MIQISLKAYVAAVISAHKAGTIDAHREYTLAHADYGNQQGEYGTETDLEFVERCAEQDYYDGPDSWLFPHLFIKLADIVVDVKGGAA